MGATWVSKSVFPTEKGHCLPAAHTTVIVLATYNEAPNLNRLLPQLLKENPHVQIVVVDDNSPDGTAALLEQLKNADNRVVPLVRASKLGYGTAILAGMKRALELGADQIVTLDADFSHNPTDIPELLKALERADVAIGSRYTQGVRVLNWQISRLLLSLFANRYLRLILGMPVEDMTSGFRAYRGDAVKALLSTPIRSVGYSFLVEVIYSLYLRGFQIIEVPITYTERREGQSKMGKRVIGEAIFRPWTLRLRAMFSDITRQGGHKSHEEKQKQ